LGIWAFEVKVGRNRYESQNNMHYTIEFESSSSAILTQEKEIPRCWYSSWLTLVILILVKKPKATELTPTQKAKRQINIRIHEVEKKDQRTVQDSPSFKSEFHKVKQEFLDPDPSLSNQVNHTRSVGGNFGDKQGRRNLELFFNFNFQCQCQC
jgi:hypothetical protein